MSNIILTGDTSGTLNIAAPLVAGTNTQTLVAATGTLAPLISGTAVSASGTSVDFTGIPSWVKRITVMFSGLSTNSTSLVQVQLGAGSVTTSGYNSYVAYAGGSNQASGNTYSSGFILDGGLTGAAAFIRYGILTFTNITGNTWVAGLQGTLFNGTSYWMVGCSGSIALGSVLDRVRITSVNGTDTFDAGTINILYE